MWFLTVFGLMWSSAAIWALSLPFAISFSTWISRSESSERIVLAASRGDESSPGGAGAPSTRSPARSSDSPAAAARMPGHQLVDRRVLEQVAAGAGQDRVHHVGVLVGDREHEHARQRRDHRDLARRLDAADPRHVQVHHDDVGRDLADQRERVGARLAPRRRRRRPAPRAGCAARCGRGRGRRRAALAARVAVGRVRCLAQLSTPASEAVRERRAAEV